MDSNIIKKKLSFHSQTVSNSPNHSSKKNNSNLKKTYNKEIQLSNSKNIDVFEPKTIRDINSKNSFKSNKAHYSKSTLAEQNSYSNNVTNLRKNNKKKNKNLSLINLTMYDNSFKKNKNYKNNKKKNKNINIRLVNKYDYTLDNNNNINETKYNISIEKMLHRTNSIGSKKICNNINDINHKKNRNVKNKEKINKCKTNNTNIEYTKNLRTSSDDLSIKVKKLKKFSGLNITNNNDNTLNNFIIPDEYKNECIIMIQAYFRKYILKKKLYNNINIYIRYIKANIILNNIFNTIYKFHFINKFKQIYNINRIHYFKKLEKKLIEYKIYKKQYSNIFEKLKKLENKNYEIIKENNELKKQLKEMKNKRNNFSNNINEKTYLKNRSKNIENKIITNNFTIQNQVNIIMTKPEDISKSEIKKSIRKQKSRIYNKSKTEINEEIINDQKNKKVKFENELLIKKNEKIESQKILEEKNEKDKIKFDNEIKEEINEMNEKQDMKEIRQNENNVVNKILKSQIINEKNKMKYYQNNNKIQHKTVQIEYLQKSINKFNLILLKNLIKTKIYNSKKILQKKFLRYYYNIKYINKIEENSIQFKKEEEKIKKLEQEIEENKKEIEANKNLEESQDELRIEYKNKNLYSQEKLNRVKRKKELRELFYNKIRERQNYLHKCFTRFYYKGLMYYMKKKYSGQNSNTNNNSNKEEDNSQILNDKKDNLTINNDINLKTKINYTNKINDESIKNTNNDNNNDKGSDKNNNINNINTNINAGNTKIDEKAKEEENQTSNKYANSRKLRRLLIQKGKEKLELLRKYFYKFHQAGILLTLRKGTKRASLFKKMEGIDLETAFKTVVNNQAMNEIDVDENSNVIYFQEEIDKKMKDKKFARQMERQRIEVEEKIKNEKQKNAELYKMKLNALEIIFNKLDRNNKVVFKKKFEIFYLKSKVLSLSTFKRTDKRSKTAKGKRKGVRRSVVAFNMDKVMLDKINQIQRSNSGEKKKYAQLENEIRPIFGEEDE